MPNDSPTFDTRDKPADEPSTLGGKLSDRATQLKHKVSEYGRKAADKIDENMDSVASGLDKAAATLHGRAENLPGVEKVSGLTHAAADKLSATAGYVREHDTNRMMADVTTLVKNNPGPSLLAAGVIGFLVGRAFRSSSID